MKNYNESFETKKDDMHISVSSNYQENCVIIGIDVGVDGFYAGLTTKEVDKLISMLKMASKKVNTNGGE